MEDSSSMKFAAGYELKDSKAVVEDGNSLKTYDKDKRSTAKTKKRCSTLKERYSLTLGGTEHGTDRFFVLDG